MSKRDVFPPLKSQEAINAEEKPKSLAVRAFSVATGIVSDLMKTRYACSAARARLVRDRSSQPTTYQ